MTVSRLLPELPLGLQNRPSKKKRTVGGVNITGNVGHGLARLPLVLAHVVTGGIPHNVFNGRAGLVPTEAELGERLVYRNLCEPSQAS